MLNQYSRDSFGILANIILFNSPCPPIIIVSRINNFKEIVPFPDLFNELRPRVILFCSIN